MTETSMIDRRRPGIFPGRCEGNRYRQYAKLNLNDNIREDAASQGEGQG